MRRWGLGRAGEGEQQSDSGRTPEAEGTGLTAVSTGARRETGQDGALVAAVGDRKEIVIIYKVGMARGGEGVTLVAWDMLQLSSWSDVLGRNGEGCSVQEPDLQDGWLGWERSHCVLVALNARSLDKVPADRDGESVHLVEGGP